MDPTPIRIPNDYVSNDDMLVPMDGANWCIQKLNVDALRSVADGSRQIVCVGDTGADKNHPILQGHILDMKDFTNSSNGPADTNSHGTHTATTIAGTNPQISVSKAKLLIGKCLSNSGSGLSSWIASVMLWGYEKGARVFSFSIGSSQPSPEIDEAGKFLDSKGCWVFCAAGNSGQGTRDADWPARFPWALSIAAIDESLRVANFSNSGRKIETAAPGVQILAGVPGGGLGFKSGTSMATPNAAGIMALYRDYLELTGQRIPTGSEIRAKLFDFSVDIDKPGVDLRAGPGYISPTLLRMSADTPPVVAA